MSEDNEIEEKPFEFKIKMDYKGNLSFNLMDYINELSDEKKKELIEFGGWWAFIKDEMAKDIIEGFASENYNSLYHTLRIKILNSEAMPELIRTWAKEMIRLHYQSKQGEDYWQKAYRDLSYFVRSKDEDLYWKMPRLPERNYSVEYPKELVEEAYKLAEEWGILFPEPERDD